MLALSPFWTAVKRAIQEDRPVANAGERERTLIAPVKSGWIFAATAALDKSAFSVACAAPFSPLPH